MGEQGSGGALQLARRLADLYQAYPQVEVVTLTGSRTSGAVVDARSDIDLCVYTPDGEFPLAERQAVIEQAGGANRADLALPYWGDGDVWFHAPSGIEVDVVYSSQEWIAGALERVLAQCRPSGGYTTCAWHSVRAAQVLFDRSGWFARLQAWSGQPYPPELRRAIIAHNLPILRGVIPSYRWNIEKSLPRGDRVFIINEVTWLLASYFDVLFAMNEVPHPGAKRLLEQAERLCPRRPPALRAQVEALLALAAAGDPAVLDALDRLVDGLEEITAGAPA